VNIFSILGDSSLPNAGASWIAQLYGISYPSAYTVEKGESLKKGGRY